MKLVTKVFTLCVLARCALSIQPEACFAGDGAANNNRSCWVDFCEIKYYGAGGKDNGSWSSLSEAKLECFQDPKCDFVYAQTGGQKYYRAGAAYGKNFGRWPDELNYTAWLKPGFSPTGNFGPAPLDNNFDSCGAAFCEMNGYAGAGGDQGHWNTLSEAQAECLNDPKCDFFYNANGRSKYYKSGAAYGKNFGRWPGNNYTAWIKPGFTPTGNAGPVAFDPAWNKCGGAFCEMIGYAGSGASTGGWDSFSEAQVGCLNDPKCDFFYKANGKSKYYKSGAAYGKNFGRWPGNNYTAWIKPGFTPTGNAGPVALDDTWNKCGGAFCEMIGYAGSGASIGNWDSFSEAQVGCLNDPKCDFFYNEYGESKYYKSGTSYGKNFGRWPGNKYTAWVKPGFTPTGNAGPVALDDTWNKCVVGQVLAVPAETGTLPEAQKVLAQKVLAPSVG